MEAYIAIDDDYNRKPCIGIWEELIKENEGKKIDMKESFYCGDAAGRKKNKTRKKNDFSASDYLFARNFGIKFYTPEMLFLKQTETIPPPTFNPRSLVKNNPLKIVFKGGSPEDIVPSKEKEVIIFVGSAGSGKSSFYFKHLSSYTRIN